MTRRTFLTRLAVAPAALVAGAPALSSTRAQVGLVLPLTGVQSVVATELLAGYRLAANNAKRRGIYVDYVVEDDFSKPANTAAAIRKLASMPGVVAASGVVGTPHAQAAIPEARNAQLPLVGIRSGAAELRDGNPFVYHLRSTYEDELSRMLHMLADTTPSLAVVYSNDSFGKGAVKHLQAEAARKDVRIAFSGAADRDGADIETVVKKAVAPANRALALVLLMISRPAVTGLRTARASAFYSPTFTMSFTAGGELLSAGTETVRGLGLVSAFPLPRLPTTEIVESFRVEAAAAGVPPTVALSITALEGFTYGLALAQGIARASSNGTPASREALVGALSAKQGLRVGSDLVRFDERLAGRNHLQIVYFDQRGELRT